MARALSTLVLALCLGALTSNARAGDFVARDAYAWIAAAGKSGAVYMTVTNHGEEPARVTSANSAVAHHVALHTHVIDVTGVARMQKIEDGIAVDAGASVKLEPGGLHVMLMGLRHKPEPGEVLEVMLELETGDQIHVHAPVIPTGEAPEHTSDHDH